MNFELGHKRRRAILVLLAVTVLVVVMDITILNVALDSIQKGLKASNAGLQWSLDSYMIAFAAFLFTGGVCADRFGRKKTLVAGLVLFGATSALAAFSGSVGELIAWRGLMGVGAAVVPTVTLAIIINVFPPAERPGAIAVWAAAAGVAFAAGPIVGGLLLEKFWWGSVFLINAPLVVVGVLLIGWIVPESRNPNNTRFDPLGTLLSILAIGALVYGIVTGGDHDDWSSPRTLGPILGGIALVAVLVAVERRLAAPSLDVSLFRSARFSAGTGAIALAFFALMGAIYVTTFYFQAVLGYSPLKAGLLMLPMGLGSVFMSSRCPTLVPRLGARIVVAAGTTAMAVTFLAYSQFGRDTSTLMIAVVQLVFGLGWGCIMAPATASLMSVVPPARAGAGQAVSQTVRQVAAALGVAVIGSVLGAAYRTSIASAVGALPAGLRAEATGSIGGTLHAVSVAHLSGPDGPARVLLDRASQAYLSGMRVTMFVVAAVALLATLVSLRWLSGRPPASAARPPAATPAAPAAPATQSTAVTEPSSVPN
ncbi:MAG TPA: MFS transporter [Mycobacteriales bacterium]|nr:MFS transporter [Mycobacteriales bacterium]